MSKYNQYLEHCFKLAKKGESLAFPNPIVGSVIVHQDKIIGHGFHREAGQAHAEVNAINDAIINGYRNLFPESTIYVSLEPCSHTGKTPPCADLIIKHKFKRLVFSSYDPNPLVHSTNKIRASGIEVIEPKDIEADLVKESNYINKIFFKTIKEPNSAWITVKIASTADGRMITNPNEPRWITNQESRKDVHRMRSCHDLLITSIRTVEADDPEYTVRHSTEELKLSDIKNPDIAILKLSTDFSHRDFKIFKQANRKVHDYKVSDLKSTIQEFINQGYKRIMVEAGPKLSQAFIETRLVDEIIHYQAGKATTEYAGFKLIKTETIEAKQEPSDNKRYFINAKS